MGDVQTLARHEWLTTNGAGAFASSTVAGGAARRYHGLLIAAIHPPTDRRTLLGDLDATVIVDGAEHSLATHIYQDGTVAPEGWRLLREFVSEPVPTWTFDLPGDATLVRRIFLARGSNTVYITFRLSGAPQADLVLAPLLADKDFHHEQREHALESLASGPDALGWTTRLHAFGPTLRLRCRGDWSRADWWHRNLFHATEAARGFDAIEDLYCPATVRLRITDGETVAFCATTEESAPATWREALGDHSDRHDARVAEASDSVDADLRCAADLFVVETPSRATVLAGYPWFGDWGRDTFIALPGLLLTTHRYPLARRILLDFVPFVRDGRIPNRFPDTGDEPAYNNIDATLWYVRACRLYAAASGDTEFLGRIGPTVSAIVDAHQLGTVGDEIRADADGLLRGGGHATNLTWMDAKIGDWVVTPRVGKPVEVNALWVDALDFLAILEPQNRTRRVAADRALSRFVTAFTRNDGRGLWDVLPDQGAPDPAIRPNQVLAAAVLGRRLPVGVLQDTLATAERYLLTPYGLRTLAPDDPAYRGRYEGDPAHRDSAYHQGTVWPWLIGGFIDLVRLVHGLEVDVRRYLEALEEHRSEGGLLGIAEIFDGDAPHRANGCPWQAWSVAELLRVR